MRPRKPPRRATALLTRLGPKDPALAGDLLESYRGGRSAVWYWRQVAGAIVFGAARDVRTHKVATLRALALGGAFVWFNRRFVTYPVLNFDEYLFTTGLVKWFYFNHWGFAPWISQTPINAVMFAIRGWLVGRTHRRYGPSVVVAYAVFAACMNIPLFVQLTLVPLPDYPVTRLVQNLFFIYPFAALLGGVAAGSERQSTTARVAE